MGFLFLFFVRGFACTNNEHRRVRGDGCYIAWRWQDHTRVRCCVLSSHHVRRVQRRAHDWGGCFNEWRPRHRQVRATTQQKRPAAAGTAIVMIIVVSRSRSVIQLRDPKDLQRIFSAAIFHPIMSRNCCAAGGRRGLLHCWQLPQTLRFRPKKYSF